MFYKHSIGWKWNNSRTALATSKESPGRVYYNEMTSSVNIMETTLFISFGDYSSTIMKYFLANLIAFWIALLVVSSQWVLSYSLAEFLSEKVWTIFWNMGKKMLSNPCFHSYNNTAASA